MEIRDEARFEVVFTGEATRFLRSLPVAAASKIKYNIEKSKLVNDPELFKKLEGSEIWEFRTLYNGVAYRLFAFWDTEQEVLVVVSHGIVKKTQKTPHKEIRKAEAARIKWFNIKK